MEYYNEPQKSIPVYGKYDVLVIGSGPSGISAAIAAGRNGAKVLLIEQLGIPGGISTAGLMSHWTGDSGSRLYKEIIKRSSAMNDFLPKDKFCIEIDPDKLKLLYLEMLEESGVKVRFYTFACDVIKDGERITGIVTESKSGREAIYAKVIIDASGDGDIAARSGVPYVLGRETDGKMQPASIMFKVGGVDTERAVFLPSFESTYETPAGELQELARKILPSPAGHVLLYKSTLPGIVTCNMTNCIDINGTNADDLTKAEIICRKQIYKIEAFLRQYVPGYEKCYVISTASLIGIRETRHFEGLYTITGDDILKAKVFADWIVKDAKFNFDVHNVDGAGLDKTGAQKYFPQKMGYTIPYRCLLPVKTEGLLLCGRNISGTHMAHSNFRVMPICVGIGEGAGTAAALAVKKDISLKNIDIIELQKLL